jgi:hypothetical protein
MVHLSRLVKMDFLQGRRERNGEAYIFWYVDPLSAARTKQKAIFTCLKTQKPSSPLRVRDEGLTRASWYHPGSVLNDQSPFTTLPLARYVGEAESITRVSRIQARRRVQQYLDWLAPSANSLRNVVSMTAFNIPFC